MSNNENEAPFTHVSDDTPTLWEECNHSRYYTFGARLRRLGKRLKKVSGKFDDWFDQSFLVGMTIFGVMFVIINVIIALCVYAQLP